MLSDLAFLLIFAYSGLAVGTMIRLRGKISASIIALLGFIAPAMVIVALPFPLMKSILCGKDDPFLIRTINALLVPVFCLAFYPNLVDIIVDTCTNSTFCARKLPTMILQEDSTREVIHNDKQNTNLKETTAEQVLTSPRRFSIGCLKDFAIVFEHILCLFKEKSIFASV